MITLTEEEAEAISIILTDETIDATVKMEEIREILGVADDPDVRDNPDGVTHVLINNINPDIPTLTPIELEELNKAILNNGDIGSVLENATDSNMSTAAAALTEVFDSMNPNNPDSDITKIGHLENAAKYANAAIESASILKATYEEKERERIADEIALEKIWNDFFIDEVEETEITVTSGYDTDIRSNRKELTSPERRERRDKLVGNVNVIIRLITDAKTNHLPNGLRDQSLRKVKVWRFLDGIERMLIEIRNFDMANVIIRSDYKIPETQNILIALLNFYDDWEDWNNDLYIQIINIEEELANLANLMDRYKNELALL
jgi:hypothetical protein